MHISEVYKRATEQIIRDLEAGTPVWVKPWKTEGGGLMPFNFATKRTYNGINVPILWQQASSMGYASQGWLTYKQAEAIGAQVRKGERGTIVVFTKKLRVGEEDDPKSISMLRNIRSVFSVLRWMASPFPRRSEGRAGGALRRRGRFCEGDWSRDQPWWGVGRFIPP